MKRIVFFSLLILILIFPLYVKAETINVNDFEELKSAILNGESEINLENDITFDSLITISNNITINGNNHKLIRSSTYLLGLFSITNEASLKINNLIIDGNASNWQMDIENGANNSQGYFRVDIINTDGDTIATQPLIVNAGELVIKSSTFQNIRNNNTASISSGGALRTTGGTVNIEDTTFKHCASYREGGAVFATGGLVTIKNSTFMDNTAGAGYKGQTHGGAIKVDGANDVVIDNTLFQDNFAQHNGGAIMLQTNGSNIKITNSIFKHNMAGNDGAAISLESSSTKHKIEIIDTVFEENVGLATSGQSMGTIWLDSWKNDENMAAEFRNLTFKNNNTAHGSSFASYGTNSPYCIIDNVESYNNKANGMGSYFFQDGTYLVSNTKIHDNTSANGGGIVSVGGNVIVTDSIITKNTATQRGGGAMAVFGTLTIKNSEIINNHANSYGGGIAAYSMYANYGNPVLHLENVLVKDNSADISGGGLSIQDTGTAHSTISVDDESKIYDNSATVAADDVLYTHANATSGASTTLDNISIAGIIGIDGWYHDNQDDRFKDTQTPTVFEDYVDNDGSIAFYIKAAGLSHADYDGNGGTTEALPVTIKYGSTYIVDDDIPVRENYTFTGWNTKADGTGIVLNAGDSYDGSEGFVLYAMWTEKIENPNTMDTIMSSLITLIINIVILSTITICYKKRIN